jgi:SAM-dependent methyltransferase
VYERLYRTGGLDLWDSEHHREDIRLIRQQLAPFEGDRLEVVDIGCYTGQLLSSLPRSFRLYGVEPNIGASRVAATRGISVLATTVDDFALMGEKYDVIMACDVIEHVPDPLTLLRQLGGRLKGAGRLIITTGNSNAWLWRIMGANYWYCRFPEHISFVGTEWVQIMPARAGLKLIELELFNYRGGSINLPRILAAFLHKISPKTYRALRDSRTDADVTNNPPGNGATRDHMLCVFELS